MSNSDNSDFSTYYTYSVSNPAALLPMSIVMAGDEQCSSTYRIRRVNAEISVLIYLLAGAGELELDGTTYELHANDVLTLPQGASYEYRVKRSEPWRILWFNITGETYPYLLKKYELLSVPVYTQTNSHVPGCFAKGMEICKADAVQELVQDSLCAVVYEIVLALWRQYHYSHQELGLAQQLRQLIDDGITGDQSKMFSIEDAALLHHVSVRQLERAFKLEYNSTPYSYFQQQKLLLAKQYLNNTTLTVKEISNKLGFCDQYYFSNCFKNHVGVSPKTYRQR